MPKTNEKSDIMEYKPYMEKIDSDMLTKVLEARDSYDYTQYTARDVKAVLSKESVSMEDYAVLLSPSAENFLEEMARRAQIETRKHFGNAITLFTPLYIANYCENECVYCGFNCKNKIHRAQLSPDEIDKEMLKIAETGLKEILLLTGEAHNVSTVEYIGQAVATARKYFSTIGVEVYPMNTDEYAYLKSQGADFVSVYQETYDPVKYAEQHLSGSKRVFPYRFYAQERAVMAGMRGVSFGALLGLDDFRKDAFAAGMHAFLLQRKYPNAEISFSVPRLRPYINNAANNPRDVHEKQLLQVMLAYRLLMPFAGITISTRERAGFRDNVIGLIATKISAGVKVGVGGHEGEAKGDEQFEISDTRSVEEILTEIDAKGLQAVFTDTCYL